jgi:chemotaxis protein CheC
MADNSRQFSEELLKVLQAIAKEGLSSAANGLSTMIGTTLTVKDPCVKVVPVKDIPSALGGPEKEAVGIYLKAEGDMSGHFMLVVPYDKAMEMVDMLMEVPKGTTTSLGSMERSALAEVGNLTAAFFLNAVAAMTGVSSRPTPPAVMVDMIGAILDIIVAATGGISEDVLTFQAMFSYADRSVDADFWVIPDPDTLNAFIDKKNEK